MEFDEVSSRRAVDNDAPSELASRLPAQENAAPIWLVAGVQGTSEIGERSAISGVYRVIIVLAQTLSRALRTQLRTHDALGSTTVGYAPLSTPALVVPPPLKIL